MKNLILTFVAALSLSGCVVAADDGYYYGNNNHHGRSSQASYDNGQWNEPRAWHGDRSHDNHGDWDRDGDHHR